MANKKKRPKICRLCGCQGFITKHHLIPKSVLHKVHNKNNDLNNLIVYLCRNCHNTVHNAFLEHLIITAKIDGYSKYHSIKYQIMKNFIRNKYSDIWKEFVEYWKDFIKNELQKMSKKEEENEPEDNNIL